MQPTIAESHQVVALASGFEKFTQKLVALLGHLDAAILARAGTEPEYVRDQLRKMGGEQDLMLFGTLDHGTGLVLMGGPRKARQYTIGNPLVAIQMTQHDIRAGLYAPLRVLVYEAADHIAYAEYDLPSALFGQFGNAAVTAVAQELDEKLRQLLAKADAQ
jgi:uncharacterized protein (DUF302 family)